MTSVGICGQRGRLLCALLNVVSNLSVTSVLLNMNGPIARCSPVRVAENWSMVVMVSKQGAF